MDRKACFLTFALAFIPFSGWAQSPDWLLYNQSRYAKPLTYWLQLIITAADWIIMTQYNRIFLLVENPVRN